MTHGYIGVFVSASANLYEGSMKLTKRLTYISLLTILLAVTGILLAQDTLTNATIFITGNSLTLYIPEGEEVIVEGLAFEFSTDNNETETRLFEDYGSFQLPDMSGLPTPVCFWVIRNGVQEPLESVCSPSNTFRQQVTPADVWWVDVFGGSRAFDVVQNNVKLGTCTGQPVCPVESTPDPLVEAAALARSFDADNDEWTPFIQTFEREDEPSVEMALVPGGCYTFIPDEEEICIDSPFWIDVYESGVQEGELPETDIAWQAAVDSCEMRGGRLPSVEEWEWAAVGVNSTKYPWGDELESTTPENSSANFCDSENCPEQYTNEPGKDDGQAELASAGTYDHRSWVGTADMAGNVWEWTNTPVENSVRYFIKGGAWNSPAGNTESFKRIGLTPEEIQVSQRPDSLSYRCIIEIDAE